ncbi:MAG: arginase family protein [Chloroflexota bacterium]
MHVTIIGVPYDLDHHRSGMGNAPQTLLDRGIIQRMHAVGFANVALEIIDVELDSTTQQTRISQVHASVAAAVARARLAGSFPLVLGGDCVTALGVLAGLNDSAHTGIVWFDAHGDFNTPDTTPSGYIGGMPLASAVGRGLASFRNDIGLTKPLPESHVVLCGVRDLDVLERQALESSDVLMCTPAMMQRDQTIWDKIQQRFDNTALYLHIDIDVLDPVEVPGVDYPTEQGLSLNELQHYIQKLGDVSTISAVALTAVNPDRDIDHRTVNTAIIVIETVMQEVYKR